MKEMVEMITSPEAIAIAVVLVLIVIATPFVLWNAIKILPGLVMKTSMLAFVILMLPVLAYVNGKYFVDADIKDAPKAEVVFDDEAHTGNFYKSSN
tara:strand:- start:174 stop:461 length:288 start_codon:yes stop_codon:yes gene_type:complete